MKGLANVPRIAGLHPIYIARQLICSRTAGATVPTPPLMKKPVAQLSDDDILDISAYLGSLSPE